LQSPIFKIIYERFKYIILMKKTITLLTLLFIAFQGFSQKATLSGKVLDAKRTDPIRGATVAIQSTDHEASTGRDGSFKIETPILKGILVIKYTEYETKEIPFKLEEGKTQNLGEIFLNYTGTESESKEMPVVTLSESEMSGEGEQMISGLLNSSEDIFVSTAAYKFGIARFKMRGYDSKYSEIFMNGIPMNDVESGWPVWSDWGGLNDATRNKEIIYGFSQSDFSTPRIGGVTNIVTRATKQYPGFKGSYAAANRNYNNRVMGTYSTGLLENDWAFTVSGSHRWAQEGYIPGTFYDAYAYFLAAEKKLNDDHSISVTAFGAPRRRGKRGGAPQIAYEAAGTNFYNPNWGYQDGKKRNSRVSHKHKPNILVNHYWNVNEKINVKSGFAFAFGTRGEERLTWYDSKDPRPVYYRNLPESPDAEWEMKQLDWDYFINANKNLGLFTVQNPSNVDGDSYTGIRSKYFMEDRLTDRTQYTFNSTLEYKLNENTEIISNLTYINYTGRHYKEIADLLGGEYWVDIDKFAERGDLSWDFDNLDKIKQNDLNNYNRVVKEGDKFGYDYDANVSKLKFWSTADFKYNKFDYYMSLGVSTTQFFRTGYMKNGKFPEESFGDSEKQNFLNYRIHAGGTYKITGRHIIKGNVGYVTQAPYFRESYVSPRTRDHVVDGLTSEKILSGDLDYVIRTPYIQGRASLYYTQIKDQTDVISFYHDINRTFVNYVMTGIDKTYQGVEIGLEGKISSSFSILGAGAFGKYVYSSRPEVSIVKDNTSRVTENKTVYVKNFFVSGTPQTAGSLGLNYSSPNYWWAEISANYFTDTYLSFNPARRTEEAIAGLDLDSPYGKEMAEKITEQEKLPDAFSLDFTGGKSWKIGDYYLSLFLNVDNILDKKDFNTGGYEKLRFDYESFNLDEFPPRYYYAYGRNFYLILSFRF